MGAKVWVSLCDNYGNLVNLITREPLNRFEQKLARIRTIFGRRISLGFEGRGSKVKVTQRWSWKFRLALKILASLWSLINFLFCMLVRMQWVSDRFVQCIIQCTAECTWFSVLLNAWFLTLQKEQHANLMENIKIAWQSLQGRVNGIYDSRLAKMFTDSRPSYGVKQVTLTNELLTTNCDLQMQILSHYVLYWERAVINCRYRNDLYLSNCIGW